MSSALAIQNLDGEHLGFVLTHFDPEPSNDGDCEGECVLQILPARNELFESALVRSLFPYHFRQSGEHRVKLTKQAGEHTYEITPKSEPPLRIRLDAAGDGKLSQHPNFSKPIAYIVSTTKDD